MGQRDFELEGGEAITDEASDYVSNLVHCMLSENDHWDDSKSQVFTLFNTNDGIYVSFFMGKRVPMSNCCKATMRMEIGIDTGAKLMCGDKTCGHNPLRRALLPTAALDYLFN